MNTSIFALKGHIIHTPTPKGFEIFENSYVVCKKIPSSAYSRICQSNIRRSPFLIIRES